MPILPLFCWINQLGIESETENNFPLQVEKVYPLTSSVYIPFPDSICLLPLWEDLAPCLYL